LMSARPSTCSSGFTLIGMVVANEHWQLCVFGFDGAMKWSYILEGAETSGWFLPQYSKKYVNQVNPEWSVRRWNPCPRGTYGNVLVSSRMQVVPAGWRSNFSRPSSASYSNRQLLAPVFPVLVAALLPSVCYLRLCKKQTSLLAVGKQE
jgi:hypothetical protein